MHKNVFCSVVSLWEISIKEQIGKISVPENFLSEVENQSFIWLNVELKHVAGLKQLPLYHKDPFDRMLISQALSEDLIFITADNTISQYNIPVLRA
ncbi:MAG: type II toxin-antitoxin system VapC family toxin [Balneolales bacterium]|nr:type II toxin-antitoxin system VapC family toxin [Balneolales bacterium]